MLINQFSLLMKTHIINGNIILSNKILEGGYVSFEGNKIVEVGEGKPNIENRDEIINAEGNYVSAGFIDIHTHGAGGSDFMDGNIEDFLTIANTHAKYGTTALLPTTVTCSDEELFDFLETYKKAKILNTRGSQFLGIHLEGPYFSYNHKGAQDPKNLKTPTPPHYMKILNASEDIIRWSIAPELDGAIELGQELKKRGIIASIGHTDAICEEVMEAFDNGFNLMTHFYSCMLGVTRRNAFRYAGAIEAAYLLDDMYVEIIADGAHLPKNLLKLIYKIKGPDRIALVTDSMRAAGMPEGVYNLGSNAEGYSVIVEDGVAKLMDKSAFAGSVACGNRLVRTMIEVAEVPLLDAIKMITITPAKIIGVESNKGSLEKDKDADIVMFDKEINILKTIVKGNTVYSNSK